VQLFFRSFIFESVALGDTVASQTLYEHTARHVCEQGIAAVNLSQRLAVLRLKGPATQAVLAKGCGLDLHPRHFPVGRCARTRFAQLPIVVDCIDATPQFDLYVGRSYLPYLISWLNDAAVGM
jgi:sarcosine oxidase subunit gamma